MIEQHPIQLTEAVQPRCKALADGRNNNTDHCRCPEDSRQLIRKGTVQTGRNGLSGLRSPPSQGLGYHDQLLWDIMEPTPAAASVPQSTPVPAPRVPPVPRPIPVLGALDDLQISAPDSFCRHYRLQIPTLLSPIPVPILRPDPPERYLAKEKREEDEDSPPEDK
ncbi:hypothetical protein EYF80_028101 [Liparis tanakae]|uniref:Uncharacterized protein n=1 Tax=Liparis tanakae TaxID=230148 RepID=A0A4Z2H7Q2_9TELE|nr:hypothetical protein EYF80_028101 [Liparis tanakae]